MVQKKTLLIDESLKGKRISIDFGGVYMNATIYVNGKKLGTHPNGYTPFSFDITDNVKFGKENVIAVKVDHQTPSSRFLLRKRYLQRRRLCCNRYSSCR